MLIVKETSPENHRKNPQDKQHINVKRKGKDYKQNKGFKVLYYYLIKVISIYKLLIIKFVILLT